MEQVEAEKLGERAFESHLLQLNKYGFLADFKVIRELVKDVSASHTLNLITQCSISVFHPRVVNEGEG